MTATSKITRALTVAMLALVLGACSQLRSELGIGEKNAPDEFRVVSSAPLALPPDFNLRPPAPGAPRPQEGTTTEQAKTAVFRRDGRVDNSRQVEVAGNRSAGEKALLQRLGTQEANPDIRQLVDRESERLNEEQESLVQDLLFWKDKPPPGKVVDADAESRRLRENEATGESVTAGDTPTIERKEEAIFEGLFDGGLF